MIMYAPFNPLQFAKRFNCYLVDLRNHGDSDHHDSMTYREMAEDVLRYADKQSLDKFALVGHNMGAKTAMALSLIAPERVSALVSLDTAPISHSGNRKAVEATVADLKMIQGIEVEGKTRGAAQKMV